LGYPVADSDAVSKSYVTLQLDIKAHSDDFVMKAGSTMTGNLTMNSISEVTQPKAVVTRCVTKLTLMINFL